MFGIFGVRRIFFGLFYRKNTMNHQPESEVRNDSKNLCKSCVVFVTNTQ
jgi:hypothetical protein